VGDQSNNMATVEQYLSVLAGAQSAQNAEAQRAAAQMQIEVRPLGCRIHIYSPTAPPPQKSRTPHSLRSLSAPPAKRIFGFARPLLNRRLSSPWLAVHAACRPRTQTPFPVGNS
jgi:hypothetical protein